MIRERLPYTFFEKVANLINYQLPNFFNRPFKGKEDFNTFITTKPEPRLSKKSIPVNKAAIIQLQKQVEVIEFLQSYYSNEISLLNNLADRATRKDGVQNSDSPQAVLNLAYIARMSSIEQESTAKEVIMTALLKTMHEFNLSGKKIFRVEQVLMNELINTDCSKIDDEFLQLPYDSICFHFPFNETIKIRESLIKWCFITQVDIDEDSEFNFFSISESGSFYSEKFLFNGGYVQDQVTIQIKNKFGESPIAISENTGLINLITSCILYLNSTDVDETMIHPDASLLIKEKISKIPVCSLGRNIVIHKNSLSYGNGESTHAINVLKWTVRGHFRKQKVGHERKETKIIWIRPFLKGRERENESINAKPSIYTVK
jgi:hypothetical protein